MYKSVVMLKMMRAMTHSGAHPWALFRGKRKYHMKKLNESISVSISVTLFTIILLLMRQKEGARRIVASDGFFQAHSVDRKV